MCVTASPALGCALLTPVQPQSCYLSPYANFIQLLTALALQHTLLQLSYSRKSSCFITSLLAQQGRKASEYVHMRNRVTETQY